MWTVNAVGFLTPPGRTWEYGGCPPARPLPWALHLPDLPAGRTARRAYVPTAGPTESDASAVWQGLVGRAAPAFQRVVPAVGDGPWKAFNLQVRVMQTPQRRGGRGVL